MAAPYYGDPETLRLLSPNLPSMTDEGFAEDVERYDRLVRPLLEADLHGMFRTWKPPSSQNDSIVSVLWLFLMVHHMQSSQFASNTIGVSSAYGGEMLQKYNEMIRDVKAGRVVAVGASRHSAFPVGRAYTNVRIAIGDGPDEPKILNDLIQHGLRR